MAWYQPGVLNGYSKFYTETNDPDREDRFGVSDAYLDGLLLAFRQAYVNAGGPDFEDTDSILLDRFAARGITTNTEAAAYGREEAAADLAAGQEVHASTSILPGGAIPVTAPMQVVEIQTAGSTRAAGIITGSGSMPIGQPAFGGVATPAPQLSGGTPSSSPIAGAGIDMGVLIMLGLIGVGAWLLFSGK
jgi:hypothetical protein